MLKSAIEKIESMVEPSVYEKDDHSFLINRDGEFAEIREEIDLPEALKLNSLDAIVKMIRTEALTKYSGAGPIYVDIPSHLLVESFLQPQTREIRPVIYSVHATDVPGWDEETKLSFERAAVALQTRFQDSPDRAYTLQLLSQITTGAKVTYNDIGVATTVVTQKGVSLQQNATIKPLVSLRPYRTFQELEQPDGLFLIRIDERGISFVEADGGMWKLEARKRIKSYLDEALSPEIEAGSVVVML